MKSIEYRGVVDKSGWNDGPWFDEPDKRQWPDEATGLPCLMVRGPSGSWCGYVGVPPGHPAHGLHYDGEPNAVAEERSAVSFQNLRAWSEAGHPPLLEWQNPVPQPPSPPLSAAGKRVSELEVHGGLTFAAGCADQSRAAWEEFRTHRAAAERETERFSRGDAARWLLRWKDCFDDYDRWCARMQETAICHLPDPGEPDDVWWFGFDCAHFGDRMPGHEALLEEIGAPPPIPRPLAGPDDEVYRDVAYVEGECAALAQQLAAITAADAAAVEEPLP